MSISQRAAPFLFAALLAGPVSAQVLDPVDLVDHCGGYRMTVALGGEADLAATQAAAEVLAERLGKKSLFGMQLFDAVTVQAPGELVIHRAGRVSLGQERGAFLVGGGQLDIYLGVAWQEDETVGPGERALADDLTGDFLRVMNPPVISAIGIASAEPGFDHNGAPAVFLRFDAQGARDFGQATLDHQGEVLALVLDDRLLTAPRVMGHIPGGEVQITGSFTAEETAEIAVVLRSGVLPHEITVLSEEIVAATATDTGPCAALPLQED